MQKLSPYYYNFSINIYSWKQEIYYKIKIVVLCNLICLSFLKFWVSNKIVRCFVVYLVTLTFWGPCFLIYSYNRRQQDALFLNFTLLYNSTCFGHNVHHQESCHCIHNNIYTSNFTHFKISVWQIPIAVNTVSRLLMMDSKCVRNM